ncbi:MAG: ABC transporter ATP-binding protein/permease [Lachnospiraceae bacterium]|nr:ABC transporter ATP-binding protein/permease [Lachnospiraceae bacterium]
MFKDLKSVQDVWNKMLYILTPKQKRLSILVFFMILIGAVLETLGVSIIIPLVQAMVSTEQLMQNEMVAQIADQFNITTGNQLIAVISGGVIVIYILKNLYLICLSIVRVNYASHIRRELSMRIMRAYMKRNYAYFINMKTADMIRGVGYDCSGVYEVIFQSFKMLTEGITVACICAFIIYTDAFMACGVIIILGISLICLIALFRKRMKRLGDDSRACASESNRFLFEAFQGIKDVFIFKGRQYYVDHYGKYYGMQQQIEASKTVAAESPAFFIEAVSISGLIIVVCLKLLTGTDASTFIPQLAAFAVAAFRVLPSIGKISSSFNQFVFMCPTVTAVYDNLREFEKYESRGIGLEMNESVSEALPFTKEIRIEGLCWKYENSDKIILDNLNLTIPKGVAIGLIGQSGAGKSTLADILLGLFVPQNGKIEIDGVSIADNLDKWRNTISYVPQTVFLRDDTIRNNIAFGIEESRIDDKKVERALEQAQLKSVVDELPDGIDTYMGERGIRFSGGQRQRVAIARALYNDPEILVLDEATAALDNETEAAVMEAIDALHGHKTLIIVAHRLSTIQKCDKIYEIVDGIAVERDKDEVIKK